MDFGNIRPFVRFVRQLEVLPGASFSRCCPLDARLFFVSSGEGRIEVMGNTLELRTGSVQIRLVMATLLIMTPTVFFAFRRLFDLGDRVWLWFKGGRLEKLRLFGEK